MINFTTIIQLLFKNMIKCIMIKKKNLYNLEYIEKIITYIPTIFIVILVFILISISYIILKSKEKRETQVIIQKSVMKYKYQEKEKLQNFVVNIRKGVNSRIISAKTKLQRVTYKSIGYIDSSLKNNKSNDSILSFLKKVQQKEHIAFVFFSGNNLKVYLGKDIISYIRELIFGANESKKYNKLVLRYIYSQGKNNFQYWIDDIKKTVRVSFFDMLREDNKMFFLGAFSTINSLRSITKEAIISSIKSGQSNYIWFYDGVDKKVYNFFGNKKFIKAKIILNQYKNEKKYKILRYYVSHENENIKFKNQVYFLEKFEFIIATNFNIKNIINSKTKQILKIKQEYKLLFFKIIVYMLFISFILIVFSFIFSKFVKNVFKRYNRRLQLRKDSLQHWKKRFELAIIASNDGMWDIDFSKNSIYFSKKWLEISGYGRDDIKSFGDWFALIHKDDRDNVQEQFDGILQNKKEHLICEYRLKTKDNGYKWILARGKVFRNENNAFKRMLMMSMDIDKTKRMSKELLNVELLVKDGKIVILKWNYDKNLSVNFVSNSIKNYGYVKNDFESGALNYMDIVYAKDKKSLRETIAYNIQIEQKSFSKIYRIIDNANKIRWVYTRVLLLKDDMGEIKYLYGYIYDITKIKNSEEDLKLKVKKEIEKNRQKDSFLVQQNKLAAMGSMLGSISHQWRQPLNNVQLILHFLRDNFENREFSKEQMNDFVRRAKTQIEYMSQTIEDFRNFYKPSKGKNRFNLKNSVLSTLRIVEDQFKNSNIKIDLSCNNEIILYNYENELKQSLLNIFNNAKDAILQKRDKESFEAILKIEIKIDDNFAKIIIQNNGGEIERDIIDRIFEPYFTTKFETQGTGIGLYMTKIIIEKNLKGKIEVKNINQGVSFKITLPIEEKNE